ncbi:MAG: hypothetical protein R2864_03000 [Syntrophotaleaceae bacterium]
MQPSYSYYATLAAIQGRSCAPSASMMSGTWWVPDRYPGQLFFLVNPNAPLGFCYPLSFIEELAGQVDGMLVVDEAYADLPMIMLWSWCAAAPMWW